MTANANEICLRVPLSEQEAWDLAQFLKRAGFADFRSQAADDEEAYRLQAVIEKIRSNLKALDIDPR